MLQRLVKAPMFLIQISIDGPDAEIHNACRPGANPRFDNFSTIVSAIDKIREIRKHMNQRLPLIASLTTINNLNYNRLLDIYDRFQDKVDICVFLSCVVDRRAIGRQADQRFRRAFRFQTGKALRLDRQLEAAGYRCSFRPIEEAQQEIY